MNRKVDMASIHCIVERCCTNETLSLEDKFALLAVLEDASRDESEIAEVFHAMAVFVLSQPHLICASELKDDALQSLIELRLIEAIQLGPMASEPWAAVRFALLLPGESMVKFLARPDASKAIVDCLQVGKYPLNVQTALGVVRALHTCWNLSTPFLSGCGHETGGDAARMWQCVVDWAEVAVECIVKLCLMSSTIEEAAGGLAALQGLLFSHDACTAGHENEVRLLIGRSPRKRENSWNSAWKGQELSNIAFSVALPKVQDILERQRQMAGGGQACAVDACTMLSLAVLSVAVNDSGVIVGCPLLPRRLNSDDTSPFTRGRLSSSQYSTEMAVSCVTDWVFDVLLGSSLECRYEEEAAAAAMAAFDFARTPLLAEKKETLVRKAVVTTMKLLPPPPTVIDGPLLDLLASLVLAMPWIVADDDPLLNEIFCKVCHCLLQVSSTQVRMRLLTDISLRALAICDYSYHAGYGPASHSILEGEWLMRIVENDVKVEPIFEEVLATLLVTCRGLIASCLTSMGSVVAEEIHQENNPHEEWFELGVTLLEISACCVNWPSTTLWFPLRAYTALLNLILSTTCSSTSSFQFPTLRDRLVELIGNLIEWKFPNPNVLDSASGHLPLLQVLCTYVPVLMGELNVLKEGDSPTLPRILLDLLSRFAKMLHGGTADDITSIATAATCLLQLGIECEDIAVDAEDLLWHEANQFTCEGLESEAHHMLLAACSLQSVRDVSIHSIENHPTDSRSVGRASLGVAPLGTACSRNGGTISLNNVGILGGLKGGRSLLKEVFGGPFTPLLHIDGFIDGQSPPVIDNGSGERNRYFPCFENAILDRLHAQIKKMSCHQDEAITETGRDINVMEEACQEVNNRVESPRTAIESELVSAEGRSSDWVALNGGSDPLHITACHNSPKVDENWEGSNGIVDLHLRVYNATAFKLTRTVHLHLSFGPGVKPRGCSTAASLTICDPLMPGEFVCWDVPLDISPLCEFVGTGEVIVSVVAEFPGMEPDEELETDSAAEILRGDDVLAQDEEDLHEGVNVDENGEIVASGGPRENGMNDAELTSKIMRFSFLDYHVPIVRLLRAPPSDALSLASFRHQFSSSVGSSVLISVVTARWVRPFASDVEKIRQAVQGVNTSVPPASCAIRIPNVLQAPSQDFLLFHSWLLLTHCGHIITAQLTAVKEALPCGTTPNEKLGELDCRWCGRLEVRCTSEALLLALTGADRGSQEVLKFLTKGVFELDSEQKKYQNVRSGNGTVFNGIQIPPLPQQA